MLDLRMKPCYSLRLTDQDEEQIATIVDDGLYYSSHIQNIVWGEHLSTRFRCDSLAVEGRIEDMSRSLDIQDLAVYHKGKSRGYYQKLSIMDSS
jgi:hypothetical protein